MSSEKVQYRETEEWKRTFHLQGAEKEASICPKCGRPAVVSGSCGRCGLILSRYDEFQARKRCSDDGVKDVEGKGVEGRRGSTGTGRIRLFLVAALFCVAGLAFVLNPLVSERRNGIELARDITGMLRDGDYAGARALVEKFCNCEDHTGQGWFEYVNRQEDLASQRDMGREAFKRGVVRSRRGAMEEASDHFTAALEFFERCGEDRSIAVTAINLATCLRILNKNRLSLNYFQYALDVSRRMGFQDFESKALQGIGFVYHCLEFYEVAVLNLERAMEGHREAGDKRGEAMDWLILGIVQSGRPGLGATECFRHALDLSREIGSIVLQGKALSLLRQSIRTGGGDPFSCGRSLSPEIM